ncbi:MAG: hypothetical protein JRF47_14925 [Deltaproteobacteria bacterium]|nr:hypothetical protein [Deltaproteobacteria bacterium]
MSSHFVLRVAGCGLRVACYAFRVAGCAFRVTRYGLRVRSPEGQNPQHVTRNAQH